MKKIQNTALTRKMLEEWGIIDIHWNDNLKNNWVITRYWRKCNRGPEIRHAIKITDAVCKHKYSTDKSYPVISLSYNGKIRCIPLGRVIYAWFTDDIEDGMVIDHIDNNPYNNRVENLQKLTPDENLKKRFIDNPNGHKNERTTDLYKLKWNIIREARKNGLNEEELLKKIFKGE